MSAALVVDLSLRQGGTQRRIATLVGQAEAGDEFHIVCLAGNQLDVQLDHQVCRSVLTRTRWDPRLLVDLVRILRRHRPDVVDAHNVAAQFWASIAARMAGIPNLVCTVHSDYAAEHSGGRRQRWYPRVVRFAAALGARFIAVDTSVADFIKATGVSERRILVVPNAAVEIARPATDRIVLREQLGVGSQFVVMFAGRLEPVKDVTTLIAAFADPRLRALDARLWIAGDGSQRAALEQQAEKLGIADRVRFLGVVQDVPQLMLAADCVALVSRSEGLPYVVLEAAELGRPMVLTRVGSLVELLGDDGAGFVDIGSTHDVAGRLVDLASDEHTRVSLAERARQRVRGRLSATALYDATTAFYAETVRPRGPVRTASDLVGRPVRDAAFSLLRVAAPSIGTRQDTINVVTYHRIGTEASDATLDPVLRSASPAAFEQQMAMLATKFHPISISEMELALNGTSAPPPGAVLVTFDDAYADLWTHARPALQKYSIPAAIFVPTAYPDTPDADFWWDRLYRALKTTRQPTVVTPMGVCALDGTSRRASEVANNVARHVKTLAHDEAMAIIDEIVGACGGTEPANSVLSWDQLAAFAECGVTIESHTRTHAALDRLPPSELAAELSGSVDDIDTNIGRRPVALAYPTGQSSATVLEAVRDAGFSAGFTTRTGPNRLPAPDRLQLSRLDVSRSIDAAKLEVFLSPAWANLQRFR